MSRTDELKKQSAQLIKRHKMFGIALPYSIKRQGEDWRFKFYEQKFIGNRTWFIRATAFPLEELSIEVCSSDIYGSTSRYVPLALLFMNDANKDAEQLISFCGRVLSDVAAEIESRYHKLFGQLSEESKEFSQKVLETLKATEFEKDELRNQVDVWMKRETQRTREVVDLENRLREEGQRANIIRDTLRGLQRIIEQEARNLYNTRTFLSGSKTIQGIRERLMIAISKRGLGTLSIYHDHKPPADLMPKKRTS